MTEVISFIRKLYNQPEGFIPLHSPVFTGNEKKYLDECIDSTFVSSVGKYVDKFEETFAKYTGVNNAIALVNGTNALHLGLLAVGVSPGSEVITQPLTFIATVNAISYTNAKPVFIDVDLETMGMSPDALKTWLENNVKLNNHNQPINLSSNKPISACIPMHTFGHPCRIEEIVNICDTFNIPVVEDAAESIGSYFNGRHTGSFGKAGIFSFNGNKTITTGGGGMLITNDVKLGKHIKHLTTQAKIPHPWEYAHDHIGYNYRMPNLNAAVGLAQMEKLTEILASKRKIALSYREFFATKETIFFSEPKSSKSNYWLNAIILANREQRDKFLKDTNEKGVMTRPVWELVNRLPMYSNCQCGDLANSEWLVDRVVNLPSNKI